MRPSPRLLLSATQQLSGRGFQGPLKVGGYVNGLVIRDNAKRLKVAEAEDRRRALKYITYNTELPLKARLMAQLELTNMHLHTRPTAVRNRCTSAGRSRGVFREFRLCRFQFRQQALAGDIPGVRKASW
ncbi:mitochondrial 40S ribosomal protein [Ascobolus immersus RN42]|uniref:Mitochondrial 40S ribosomal protein n=1 Tax=Ascobolus immersus RN42 TaxID=1160509 RepID=A0A3N4HWC8_ASCIM|nr:mitochondrial 40S ribosomal protein [Ascobolus immersus RN42]